MVRLADTGYARRGVYMSSPLQRRSGNGRPTRSGKAAQAEAPPQRLLTDEDIADLLGVSAGTVAILRESGNLGAAIEAQHSAQVDHNNHANRPPTTHIDSIPAEDVEKLRYLNSHSRDAGDLARLESVASRLENVCERLDQADGDSPEAILISEKQAAEMAGISPKTLGDRRRAGRVPRRLYRQDCRNGKVRYHADRWREYLSS